MLRQLLDYFTVRHNHRRNHGIPFGFNKRHIELDQRLSLLDNIPCLDQRLESLALQLHRINTDVHEHLYT
ncbi:hypothetical protein D3C78_1906970 [compost metagenome]